MDIVQFFTIENHMKFNRPTKKLEENRNKNISTWWNAKKTEAEWIEITDKFFLNIAPKWFTFISWLIMLGILKYIDQISESRWISLLYGISFMLMYFYLQSLLYNFPFYKLLPKKLVLSKRFASVFSIIFAGIILFFIYFFLLEKVIEQLAIK